jgi:hypothetical protein
MANTFVKIGSTITVSGSTTTTMSFSSIPSTYTDLVIKVSARDLSTAAYFRINLNGATTNGTDRYLNGNGTAASSANEAFAGFGEANLSTDTASTFSSVDIYIPNYASTTTYKSMSIDSVRENNTTAATDNLIAALWSQNTAVSSIDLVAGGSTYFAANTTASLYGIKSS